MKSTKDTDIKMDIYTPSTLTPYSKNPDDSYMDTPQSTYQHNYILAANIKSKVPPFFSQSTS